MDPKKGMNIQIRTEKPKKVWLSQFLSSITVEPTLLFVVLPSTLYQITTTNLYLEKTCRVHLALNETVCDALSARDTAGYEWEEAEVQKYVAEMSTISTFIQGFFPLCLILFLGSWSDRQGRRRPLILAPIIGEIIAVILLIFNTIYFEELPVIATAISVSLPPALMGGWPCLFLGVYSYISSIADDANKTAKIGLASTIQNIASVVGLGSSGFLLKPFGFIGIYVACFVMLICAFLYGFIRIKEKELLPEKMESKKSKDCFDIFKLEHLKETMKTCFKNGQHNRKKKIFIILLLCIVTMGPTNGEYTVVYLYTRLKFGWDEMDFSIFFIAHSMIDIVGSFSAIVILSKIFKWRDSSIGILALCTTMIAETIYVTAPDYRFFYAGILMDVFFTGTPIALRALMAKVVPEDELGRSNSVFGLSEAVIPLIFGPIYSAVYRGSIDFFPGSYFFVSMGFFTIGICLFIYFHRQASTEKGAIEEIEKLKDPHNTDT
ncbi:proton-coupled folate transporter-like isoform X2 [Harmonia axyridis]|nr:proton-coupled folate transporter-like isoform X2 [Harmonia axyridis]XP_045463913.1 proton-coupled folate transporter-like isoform X2 [Harmonia axyridis]